MQRANARHEIYKREQTTKIKEVSGIEIKIMKEKLKKLFLNCVCTQVRTHDLHHWKEGKTKISSVTDESAHRGAIAAVGSISEREPAEIWTTHQKLLDGYSAQHGIDTAKLAQCTGDASTKHIANILHSSDFVLGPHLLKHHSKKDTIREVDTALDEF